MRLESIKLAGFKSFVDPVTLAFPSNLTAIVGPNGCGKSNIIDAVRWVMGESSAKNLRGQSLDDVIFNGCTTRKPLGQASIELNFDNADGSLGGQYSSYAQISIRREITREGQSVYYLNGVRCRRRDIRDIFLGTGLGPRSYAIIEQGMISRLVEAKPEELRAYIEEAAGISKYKERRRETENRLEHTQENLNRLNDLSEELAKQAKHLERQASAAERYKTLKEEERLLKAHLQALRYRMLNDELQSELTRITETETQLSAAQDQQQTLLKELSRDRDLQNQIRSDCDALQSEYYALGNEITRLEEKLHSQTVQFKQNQQQESELSKKDLFLDHQIQETQVQLDGLREEITQVHKTWITAQENTAQSQTALKQSELELKDCQLLWEKLQAHVAQLTQQNRVSQTQNQHYQQALETLKLRIARLKQEQTEQNEILDSDKDITNLTVALTDYAQEQNKLQLEQIQITEQIHAQRLALQTLAKELDHSKSELQKNQGHSVSLMALQQEALGQREESLLNWLKKHNLNAHPRLAQLVQVETGWERAVEVALNQHIQAVCFTDRDSLEDFFNQSLPDISISLMAKSTPCDHTSLQFESQLPLPRLSTKITAPWPLDNLLAGIYAAETLPEAIMYTKQLKGYETIITREGVCLGNHWLNLSNNNSVKNGILRREREINTLKKQQQAIQEIIDLQQTDYTSQQKQLKELEEKLVATQKQLNQSLSCQADLKTRYQIKEVRLSQAKQRIQSIQQELQENKAQYANIEIKWQEAQKEQTSTAVQLDEVKSQHPALLENKTQLQKKLSAAIEKAKMDETKCHQLELRKQSAEHQLQTFTQTIANLQQQQTRVKEQISYLQQTLSSAENPLQTMQCQLDSLREKRFNLEKELKQSQIKLKDIEQQLKRSEQQAQTLETNLNLERDDLEQQRLRCHELRVRAKTLEEQLCEQTYEVAVLLNELANEADIPSYEKKLSEITRCIEQIGAVNLAALEEHQSVSERKNYLDAQRQDLEEALEILKAAIQKIDRETRSRFKETFDKINQNFQNLFPCLFSGGEASLRLQDSDLLDSGIYITAQPPGKRNSSIQLLSGGEKALTATALVFSFFQLNPAPFCMLDEVDAPLDDTNVLRFCKLVKNMSTDVQFIFISHNKIAIEMAEHLAGVTMREPGVSRLVTVDIEKAIAIASA